MVVVVQLIQIFFFKKKYHTITGAELATHCQPVRFVSFVYLQKVVILTYIFRRPIMAIVSFVWLLCDDNMI